MGAEVNEPTEMTASIKNPSFEEGLNGWEAIGFQKQTNNSPSDEGFTPRNGCRVVGLCLM